MDNDRQHALNVKLAADEAFTYNEIGALDDSVIEDIAHDYDVEVESITEELGWRAHYDE